MLKMNDYQEESRITATFNDDDRVPPIVYCALKLNGEAGEVAEKIGKLYRDKNGVLTSDDKKAITLELGDCLWYIARLADMVDSTMNMVAEGNLTKIRSRLRRGKVHGDGDNR